MNLLHHDCLPISMLLYIMLYIMPDYLMLFCLMLFACIMVIYYLLLAFTNVSLFSCFFLGSLTHSLFI